MKYRTIGNKEQGTDLEVSAIGLGCMGFSHAFGAPTEEDEAIRLIREAHDMGYTLFDSAETYGIPESPHHNELLVGKALKPIRDEVVLVSKFGISFDYSKPAPYPMHLDSSPETIRKSVEGSLERLQTDHIDLYFQHRVDPDVEPEAVAETMGELIREGKILHWGISEVDEDYLRRANAVTPVTAIENRFSMMARWHASLFPTLDELGVGFLAFSPLANGFLTGSVKKGDQAKFDKATDYRASMPQFSDAAIDENQALIDLIAGYAERHHATDAQISLAWILAQRPYLVPIPGSRKEERLRQNADASEVELSAEEVQALDETLAKIPMSDVFGGHAAEAK